MDTSTHHRLQRVTYKICRRRRWAPTCFLPAPGDEVSCQAHGSPPDWFCLQAASGIGCQAGFTWCVCVCHSIHVGVREENILGLGTQALCICCLRQIRILIWIVPMWGQASCQVSACLWHPPPHGWDYSHVQLCPALWMVSRDPNFSSCACKTLTLLSISKAL